MLECADGAQIFPPRDMATMEPQRSRTLEPGDSIGLLLDAGEIIEQAPDKEIVAAVAKDKIGRKFRSQPGMLKEVLASLFPVVDCASCQRSMHISVDDAQPALCKDCGARIEREAPEILFRFQEAVRNRQTSEAHRLARQGSAVPR